MQERFEKGAFIIPEVRSVVPHRSAVENSEMRSRNLEVRRWYLRSVHWYFILERLSDKGEVRTDRHQRSVDCRELHTYLWEVRTDKDIWEVRRGFGEVRNGIQEGRSDVQKVPTRNTRNTRKAMYKY